MIAWTSSQLSCNCSATAFCRWRWKKGPKQRWSGYFSLCPFPSWKGVFSQNGPQRSRARRCCAAKRTLHGEDRSEILDKRERGGPKWTAKMAQSLTASDTRLRSKATASATPKSYACNRRSTLSKQTPGSAYSRLIRSEEHTSELQSRLHLVCRLLLAKKNTVTPST